MRLTIERQTTKINPDLKRVVARFFFNGEARAKSIIQRVAGMTDAEVDVTITPILREFSKRHRNITRIFERHCERLKHLFSSLQLDYDKMEYKKRLLIGSYSTNEYSIESAAFFNPSLIEDVDQSGLEEGEKRVILSFRAVGEGHISSIAFRRGLINRNNEISLVPAGNYVDEAAIIRNSTYEKRSFFQNAVSIKLPDPVMQEVQGSLGDSFEYLALKKVIREMQQRYQVDHLLKKALERLLWLADSYYELNFSLDTDISDRVIFPYSEAESRGIEDARFVKYSDENGDITYYATYTAFDGITIQPKLLQTKDFYNFKVLPLYGEGAQNKNLALFPRKIDGKYVMISRIDGINNYIMYSDKINIWEDPQILQTPKYPWEFVQIGNCGSPIETAEGWLLITHGVGPMRTYCLGASLFDLDNPQVEIGRLREPLLIPNKDEREGYVPNVLYSCGSMIHNEELIIPYGLSDYASSFATVSLEKLLKRIKEDG
ncbi:glycoside hydrolase family 130 protein [Chitinophaga pendula]|uniref:glycoside hydrolase family 130 protein n=1 Tax=Chitinophaga TaxID=79328 RepID=UPI000BAF22DD|nr:MULTISPECIES: glycoside hydrolase family 130 protein [Chitinophaga]ASZ12424.1 glycosidase [Chitinophaga sp. MD30]UCJ09979.1 glycoside hydrolase family 130 protein [Chitinophaga pendula]